MIFERSILREKVTLTAVIFFTLFTIMTVFFLVRALGDVNEGAIALDVLLKYLVVMSLQYFPLIMVATVVIVIISTLSRLYKDSEMVVWHSSGVGVWLVFKPVFMLVLPMLLFLGFMNLFLTPWANSKLAAYRLNTAVSQLNLIKDGSFQSTKNGERTVYVQSIQKEGLPVFKQVFVSQQNATQSSVVTASSARAELGSDGRLFLILEDGRQYFMEDQARSLETVDAVGAAGLALVPQVGAAPVQVSSMRFGEYGVSLSEISNEQARSLKEVPVDQQSSWVLAQRHGARDSAELYRRVSDAWMIVPMAILAVVLGYTRPRTNKSWGVLMGVFVFMIYLNIIKMGESAVARDALSAGYAFVWVHGGALLVSGLAVWYRQHSWRLSGVSVRSLLFWRV